MGNYRGLTSAEVIERQAKFGKNVLTAKETKWYQILGRQFRSSFIYLLIFAAILSLILGEKPDAIFIIIFILVNAILGFSQEWHSEKSLKLLKKFISEKKIKLGQIKKDRVLFHGAAEEAVRHFPQNINVAALLSLAGIGPRRTRVKIVASPRARANTHEIEIISEAANVTSRTCNVLHPDNPKTSYLAVLSAIATLKQILEPVKIGT